MNNAGRSQRAWVVETDLSVDREMIELNTVAPISLTKCVLPHMIARRRGHVVVTSSIAGKIRDYYSYCYVSGNSSWPVWVFGTVVIEYAQSVSWPDGIKGILNQG